jgi:hypothetical protein
MKFVLISALSLIAVSATAATDDNVIVVKKNIPAIVYENTSEAHRLGKTNIATVSPVGISSSLSLVQGATFGFFLDRNSILELSVTTNTGSKELWSSSTKLKANAFAVHYKRFVLNSMYLRGGFEQRQLSHRYHYDSYFSDENDYTRSFDASVTSVNLYFGNQWQIKNFTIGCDWVGIVQPISARITNENITGSNVNESDRKWLTQDEDQYAKNLSVEAVRFYIGASW